MTAERILVLNAGSSTLKWTLLDDAGATLDGGSDAWQAGASERIGDAARVILRRVGPAVDVVGHRVVHGGARFTGAVVVDAAVRAELETLAALDPLHMRPALALLDVARAELPSVRQVAAFDTAFHAGIPDAAGYALPFEWSERFGLKRFGFHGLSVQHAVTAAQRLLGRLPAKLIVCHLGSGCSITAVAEGRSRDTTMGFTPLDGVMMATRSGSVDPGLLIHLQTRCGLDVATLADGLVNRSGLLGVSGVSGDLRDVEAAADAGNARARLAYARFTWSLRRAAGAMAGVLDGADAIVFTGGIGENDARVRRDVAAGLGFAGLRLARDDGGNGDRLISAGDSRVAALVIHAREDLVILGDVLQLLAKM